MSTTYCNIESEILEVIEEGTCEICLKIGTMFEAIVYANNQVGMFLWAKIPDTFENAYQLADRLLYETNLFITPGGIFGSGGDQYLRISLCSPVTDFEEALERIHLSELKV